MRKIQHLIALTRGATVRRIAALFPYTLLASCALVASVTVFQYAVQGYDPYWKTIAEALAIAAGIAALLAAAARLLPPIAALEKRDAYPTKAILLGIQLGFLLSFLPVFLLVWRTAAYRVEWYVYPVLINKKWIFGFYWIALASILIFPGLILRALTAKHRGVGTRGKALPVEHLPAPEKTPHTSSRSRSLGVVCAKVAVAAALAWYFGGPPWNLERHHRGIDFHEQLHLGLLQAIDKGHPIDAGPAATAYGPGSQFVTYKVMKLRDHFNIVGYREGGAVIHLATLFVFALAAFLFLGFGWGLAAFVVALAYSPLHFFSWQDDGTLGGSHGWGNGFRYLGTAMVIPVLALVTRSKRNLRFPSLPVVALGIFYGLLCWLSQENLSTTVLGSAFLFAILWVTDTISLRGILTLAGNVACGFALVWAVVLAYYVWHDALGNFLTAYFLYPSSVFQGYSDNYWSSGPDDPQIHCFHFLGVFLAAIAMAVIYEFPGMRLRQRLEPRKRLLLGFVCAVAASYPTSFFRSDSSHLMNTLVALPFVLVVALRDVPSYISQRREARWAAALALVATFFYLFPLWPFVRQIGQVATAPMSRFARRQLPPGPPPDTRVPFLRATRLLSDEPQLCAGQVSMRAFLEEASALHDLVGARPAYVESFPGTYVGVIYFMADLTPGPYVWDGHMMLINSRMKEQQLASLREHPSDWGALITANLDAAEVDLFNRAHPGRIMQQRSIGGQPYWIFVQQ